MSCQVQENVYYYFPKLSKKNVTSLNWFEFVPNQQVAPLWKTSSAYLSEDVMCEVDRAFSEAVPEFEYFGVTVMSADQAYVLARRLRQLVRAFDAGLLQLAADIDAFEQEQDIKKSRLEKSLHWYLREVRLWRSVDLLEKQEIRARLSQLACWIDCNIKAEKGMSIIGVLFGEKY